MRKLLLVAVSVVLLLVGPAPAAAAPGHDVAGAVYTMTNDLAGNEVLVYPRAARGALGSPTAYATGGLGTSAGLGNQRGLVLTEGDRWLLVVNAGSDSVSVFAVHKWGLELVDVEGSGGQTPVSVAEHHGLVYVLNSGSDNIAGFYLDPHGGLSSLPGSSRPLSGLGTGAAQVGFDPSGRVLVITEKATNRIDTYVIGRDGLATTATPQWFVSPGDTPFGFDFGKRGQLFVSEANGGGGNPGAASASSWQVHADGTLVVISAEVGSGETAACWLLVTNDGRFAYTTNTPSGTVSEYDIGTDGTLTLGDAQAATPGNGPIDMASSNDGRNLYTLDSGGWISIFRVHADGSLSNTYPDVPLPAASANGMAAR